MVCKYLVCFGGDHRFNCIRTHQSFNNWTTANNIYFGYYNS